MNSELNTDASDDGFLIRLRMTISPVSLSMIAGSADGLFGWLESCIAQSMLSKKHNKPIYWLTLFKRQALFLRKMQKSRQRLWQLRQKEKGLCAICPKPVEKWGLCEDHASKQTKRRQKKRGVKKPYPKKQAWLRVDWNLSDAQIATKMRVTTASVRYHRRKN